MDRKKLKEFDMVQQRSLLKLILFSAITLGIYNLFWIYNLIKVVNAICEGDGKNTSGLLKLVLLSAITFGIYGIVWYYSLGNRLHANGPKYNVDIKDTGATLLLWCLLGSLIIVGPIVALHKLVKNTNALAEEYNKKSA